MLTAHLVQSLSEQLIIFIRFISLLQLDADGLFNLTFLVKYKPLKLKLTSLEFNFSFLPSSEGMKKAQLNHRSELLQRKLLSKILVD